jgi:hypothetical protein
LWRHFEKVSAQALSGPFLKLILCPPKGSDRAQSIRVVVQYIDSRPARLHENFPDLAQEALRAAWPCNAK